MFDDDCVFSFVDSVVCVCCRVYVHCACCRVRALESFIHLRSHIIDYFWCMHLSVSLSLCFVRHCRVHGLKSIARMGFSLQQRVCRGTWWRMLACQLMQFGP